MPVKRRKSKRRDELPPGAEAWLRGEPGFFQFRPKDELRELWARYGDPSIAGFDPETGRTWPARVAGMNSKTTIA
jgi:hypothetical protein